ncbi:pyridoxal phosphate-dependent aminotransferase [Alkalibacter mobilis]|uniref:pyridoxal phosphate-dependent aminotransferase n=1 Tax=Alkalibacter mobilis TaxID=2787712 RepID=UPI00189F5639|nr:histidinol-phosphate transaminase [Alkalibacter mobilis]MBF7097180.1 histidinol-phosphate aminotransferase family protein [Alkalibacter mobilis]
MNIFKHGGNVWQEGGSPFEWNDFSANLNPDGVPPLMRQCICDSINEIGFYPDVKMAETTENFSEFLKFPAGNILPTNGGIGALQLIVDKEKPQKTIILQPAFVEYERLSKNIEAEIVNIPMMVSDKITYDISTICAEMSDNSMVFICSPSNPLGSMIDEDSLITILKQAEESRSLVVLDEAFIDYCEDSTKRNLIFEYDCLIVAGSLTKMFAIPGVRLGYILGSESRIFRYKEFQTPWAVSAQGVGASRALTRLTDFVKISSEKNAIRREAMAKKLEEVGFKVFPSSGNYLLVKIMTDAYGVNELQDFLKKSKILIRDCSNYHYLDNKYFRIGIKTETENDLLAGELEKADAYLNELYGDGKNID